MRGFRIFGTTADEGMELWGDSLEELLAAGVEGFVAVLLGEDSIVNPRERRRLVVSGEGEEELLVAMVNELIFFFDAHKWIPSRAEEVLLSGEELKMVVVGEGYDPDRHPPATGVKGATYHLAEVWREHRLWKARLILDL